jgi:hypothetical protein
MKEYLQGMEGDKSQAQKYKFRYFCTDVCLGARCEPSSRANFSRLEIGWRRSLGCFFAKNGSLLSG